MFFGAHDQELQRQAAETVSLLLLPCHQIATPEDRFHHRWIYPQSPFIYKAPGIPSTKKQVS
jgi:hypothetical protein